MTNGFLIAAPQSGSGKTVVTLGLLRAMKRRGMSVASCKAGPDFIDPAFHAIASGADCVNFDPWAMRDDLLAALLAGQAEQGRVVVEGMMGLFDGAADGTGSAADLAQCFDMPVVLVVDCARQSHSLAALVSGFRDYREGLNIAGVILNRVGSPRHEMLLRDAMAAIFMPVLGVVGRDERLALPSRHLGLVQAGEHGAIETFMDAAADLIGATMDWNALDALAFPAPSCTDFASIAPLGQHIAIARDEAFSFIYPHLLTAWRADGASLSFFSPLADEGPEQDAGAIYLPGGYPELHGAALASAGKFRAAMHEHAKRGTAIFGECGGFMGLGDALVDAEGKAHEMLGLLPVTTSFAKRKLHLGYRDATTLETSPLGAPGQKFAAHEFHYSTLLPTDDLKGARPLFSCTDARGEAVGQLGLVRGRVAGSYLHLIDKR